MSDADRIQELIDRLDRLEHQLDAVLGTRPLATTGTAGRAMELPDPCSRVEAVRFAMLERARELVTVGAVAVDVANSMWSGLKDRKEGDDDLASPDEVLAMVMLSMQQVRWMRERARCLAIGREPQDTSPDPTGPTRGG